MRKLELQEIKTIEIDILKAFVEFCDKNNLKYYISYGTLLGAVRHKGFIPWDDDIDVLMTRDDYNKFVDMMKKQSINNEIDFICVQNDTWYEPIGKLINNKTYVDCDKKYRCGVWIDIFPIDNYCEKTFRLNKFLRNVLISKETKKINFKNKKDYVKLFLKLLFLWVSKLKIAKYIDKRTLEISESGEYGQMTFAIKPIKIYKENLKGDYIDFEGMLLRTLYNYKDFLNRTYGDYMFLPPENKRKNHMIDAYIDD